MTFSIVHTTARPSGWRASYNAWVSQYSLMCYARSNWNNAYYPIRIGDLHNIEYVLCMDRRWGFTAEDAVEARQLGINVVWNNARKCMVDGYAFAAAASTGDVLILNSDDMFPCAKWDEELSAVIGDRTYEDFVVEVSSGTPADTRGLMVLQIMSRTRYDRLGYAMHPAYESLYADDDFSEHARQDGVVLDGRHLLFPHKHFTMGASVATIDDVYRSQNRQEAMQLGATIFAGRRQRGFTDYGHI